MGKLLAINISKERGTEKREVPQAELVADYGIMGDAHAGKWHRQVSLLSAEKIDAFRARGAQIDNGAFGENLVISGFDFKNLPLGTRFCIGDAILEMTQIGKQPFCRRRLRRYKFRNLFCRCPFAFPRIYNNGQYRRHADSGIDNPLFRQITQEKHGILLSTHGHPWVDRALEFHHDYYQE